MICFYYWLCYLVAVLFMRKSLKSDSLSFCACNKTCDQYSLLFSRFKGLDTHEKKKFQGSTGFQLKIFSSCMRIYPGTKKLRIKERLISSSSIKTEGCLRTTTVCGNGKAHVSPQIMVMAVTWFTIKFLLSPLQPFFISYCTITHWWTILPSYPI